MAQSRGLWEATKLAVEQHKWEHFELCSGIVEWEQWEQVETVLQAHRKWQEWVEQWEQ